MSKIDIFLVSDCFMDNFVRVSAVVLDKFIMDHRLVFLKENVVDFGPTPFRFFNSWHNMDGFHDLVVNPWNSVEFLDVNSMLAFKKKLQVLKSSIRKWNLDNRSFFKTEKANCSSVIAVMDVLIDSGVASKEDLFLRQHLVKKLTDILNSEAKDLAQNDKINWVVEGDENSNFFHGILKKKCRQKGN